MVNNTSKTYTESELEILKQGYDNTPESVLELSKTLSRSVHSIRSKLSSMGLYKAVENKPKYGAEKVITKEELVSKIGEKFDLDLSSLTKAGKIDLINLAKALGINV